MGGKVHCLGKRLTAVGAVSPSGPFPVTPWSLVRSRVIHTEHHNTNTDLVRVPAYGVCLDAEKPKACRFRDSTICK